MKSQEETLEEWCRSLLQAYELEDVEIDINKILSLAGVAAHSVVRPAAPLTTFIAGFAAGLAAGSGQATETASMETAMGLARTLASDYTDPGTTNPGTTDPGTDAG
ncbi:DUF6457 domain-containing protein [Arthrobacter sp. NA-172]|uniref:DUF6457 domain-containing protein n=1 Tax=Arthrobacter sp. NA-172 TaxID=3367524 RepID=UPI0037548EE7